MTSIAPSPPTMFSCDVIIPCYNYGSYLPQCVQSVVSQRDVRVRILIIDDASTDDSASVGKRLAATDDRIAFRLHSKNAGHIHTYNEGLEWATAEAVLILSPDDQLAPGALARCGKVFEAHPEVSLAYGPHIAFEKEVLNVEQYDLIDAKYKLIAYREFLQQACENSQTGIQAPAAIARTRVHKQIGGYLPALPHSGDTEVWLRLAIHGQVAALQATQAFYRIHANSMSQIYSPVSRLEQQRLAFEAHFDSFSASIEDLQGARTALHRNISEKAFWHGAHAFDRGNVEVCNECLHYAASVDNSIRRSRSWKRLAMKRRLGHRFWQWLQPVLGRRFRASTI